jgi:hypothetical protein
MKIILQFLPGTDITSAVTQAIDVAKKTEQSTETNFNGVDIVVNPTDTVQDKVNHYLNAISGSFYIGQKVKTIHDKEAEIIGIYDGKFPYVVQKIRNGIAYWSDYSAEQLSVIENDHE